MLLLEAQSCVRVWPPQAHEQERVLADNAPLSFLALMGSMPIAGGVPCMLGLLQGPTGSADTCVSHKDPWLRDLIQTKLSCKGRNLQLHASTFNICVSYNMQV